MGGEFARSRELQQRAGRIKNLTTVLNAVYLPLCSLAMFVLLAGPARGSMSAGAFLTFNTAVTMLLTSITQLTGAFVSAAAALPMFEQIKPVLDEAPEVRGASTQPGVLSGEIEARNLSFRYTDDGPLVLDDVSLQVRPGEFVAIVGPSGCGKSTLLRLLIGFDRPVSGSVLYDGQDLASLDQAAVRRSCGVVLQNAQPFTGSILDCICGAEVFTQEEAWEAAAMAGLAEDIQRMPMGLHTMIAGGGSISGGQRQRLMIAQALVRRPRILFFDEATSALDNETQRIVIESTRSLNATRIVIAHRLSTVLDADRVIVMSDGRVVQQGPCGRTSRGHQRSAPRAGPASDALNGSFTPGPFRQFPPGATPGGDCPARPSVSEALRSSPTENQRPASPCPSREIPPTRHAVAPPTVPGSAGITVRTIHQEPDPSRVRFLQDTQNRMEF